MNDVIYQYDGSLDGFLCCVYESYVYKEAPAAFCCDEDPLSLYEVRTVVTQPAYSQRVSRGIAARSGKALAVVRRSFLTCLPDKEARFRTTAVHWAQRSNRKTVCCRCCAAIFASVTPTSNSLSMTAPIGNCCCTPMVDPALRRSITSSLSCQGRTNCTFARCGSSFSKASPFGSAKIPGVRTRLCRNGIGGP